MFISAYHRYTGTDIELHSTRFKRQLLSRIPGLQGHTRGKQMSYRPMVLLQKLS